MGHYYPLTYYTEPPFDPELLRRFTNERETKSSAFDRSSVFKNILDHYDVSKLSVEIVSKLSPRVLTDLEHADTSVKRKRLRGVYSKIAPSVVSISSFLGVERKIDCSGLIIDWNSNESEATILTSAKLLQRPKKYSFEFYLIVRMADGTLLLAKEDYVDYYHNLLTLKVKSTVELKVVDLRSRQEDIVEGMNVIALGRLFYSCNMFNYTGELYLEHPYFGCDELLRSTCRASVMCEGGPLITDTGYVVGINFFDNCVCVHPLPTSIILRCLDMWRSFSTVVRPWFGMSVVDADQLSYHIWEKFDISTEESFVVVKKVYEGSPADKNDVRSGDLVGTCNGIPIRSAKQYFQLLSEASRKVTDCGDLGQPSFKVVINPSYRRTDNISIEADYFPVDDKRFYDCWPRVEADEWSGKKFASQENPRI